LKWGEGFDGVSQTGQPVAPGLPAADLREQSQALLADGSTPGTDTREHAQPANRGKTQGTTTESPWRRGLLEKNVL
jgi:hypothetical protein